MRHTTYKHLEARLRIGAFSIGQWTQITIAAVLAAAFGGYLSPLPAQATIFVSILLAGLPVAVSYGAMGMEFSVGDFVVAAVRYWREPRLFPPGPGEPTVGYALHADAPSPSDVDRPADTAAEGSLLWDA